MSSFPNQTASFPSTSNSSIPDSHKKLIKTKLVGIFEKIQSPVTEKTALSSYLEFLNEFDLYDPSNKTPFYILKHISAFISSLSLDNKKQALKLFPSFFLVFPSLSSPPLVSYLDFVLKLLQSHLNKETARILANCFEDIVKNLNSLSQGKPVSIVNNMLYNYSIANSNIKYGMMCLKKLIENSLLISSDGYYEDIVNNVFFDLYNNPELADDDETKCEILNCMIRVILLKENNYQQYAKRTLDTIYLDMIHVNSILQKKVLNVIYLLVLYCAGAILPFTNEVSSMIRNLKKNKDRHVRENATLILQLYNDILDNFGRDGDVNDRIDKGKCLKRSNSQQQIILNKKNDDLCVNRSYGVKSQMKKSDNNNKQNSLGRSKSHTNFFCNKDKKINCNSNKLKSTGKVNNSNQNRHININSRTAPSGFFSNYHKRGSSTSKLTNSTGCRGDKKNVMNKRNDSLNKQQRMIQHKKQIDNNTNNGSLSINDLRTSKKESLPLQRENNKILNDNNNYNNKINEENYDNENDIKEFNQLVIMSKHMEDITNRMDMLLKSMNKLQNDTSLQISNLNSRIKTMETAINSISPPSEHEIPNKSNECLQIQSPVATYDQSTEVQLIPSPIQYNQFYKQYKSPTQKYNKFPEEPLIQSPPISPIQPNFLQSISQSLCSPTQQKPFLFESKSNDQYQLDPEQSQQISSTINKESSLYHGSPSHQLEVMKPESPLEEDIIYSLHNKNDELLLNIISVISMDDIKQLKPGLVDEMIISLLGIVIKGQQIHAIVSFIQLCLASVKQYIKGPTISTVKDIFNYVVNHKFPELSRSDVMDINTIISQLH